MTERLLLCTDLDRTLIPNGPQPESPKARWLFTQMVSRPEVTLVYVTGRHRLLVRNAIGNYALPKPDFVIGDVGTSIYRTGAGDSWIPIAEWDEAIGRDWGGFSHARLKELLKEFTALRLQEVSKQNRFKLSYYVSLHSDHIGLMAAMRDKLDAHNLAINLVWSVDEPAGVGLLDVLPERASKFHAIEFLRQFQGFELSETLFSGDSGNDMEVLISEVPAVLVANSGSDVKRQAVKQAKARGNENALYVARGGFMDMNGNYSAGIAEGAVHYHPSVQAWLETGD